MTTVRVGRNVVNLIDYAFARAVVLLVAVWIPLACMDDGNRTQDSLYFAFRCALLLQGQKDL